MLVNLATARARLGRPAAEWEGALARQVAAPGRAGQAASYNLGTLRGEGRDYGPAMESLRRALERDPNDADARWNYELLAREQQAAAQKQKPRREPKPSPSQPSSGGQTPQDAQQGRPPQAPQGGQGQQPPPQAGAPQPPNAPGTPSGMSRQQAEQLLGSLQELERLEKQRAKRSHVTAERKGKDW